MALGACRRGSAQMPSCKTSDVAWPKLEDTVAGVPAPVAAVQPSSFEGKHRSAVALRQPKRHGSSHDTGNISSVGTRRVSTMELFWS